MKKLLFKAFAFTLITALSLGNLISQNVGINATGAAPDGGAMLDIASTNKGLLIPRVNIANLNTIAPVTGSATTSMLVYNTNAGTGLGYHFWDGAAWVPFLTGSAVTSVTAGNGLVGGGPGPVVNLDVVAVNGLTTNANDIRLGGTLIQNTVVTQGTFAMDYNLNSTGDFTVQDNGTDIFQVRDDGIAFFGDDVYWRDGSIAGTNLMTLVDDGNDGRLRVYENGVVSIDMDANTQVVFNEQGLDRNFRIESDAQANQFFIDAGNDRIGIRNGAPGNMLEMTNGGVNVGATSMANFENQGTSGVALSSRNTSTTSGYNAAEFITDYAGNAFTPSGVFGLAISGTLTQIGIGVRGATNGRDGYGVFGSRISAAGVLGWGGVFVNDLGYTGFFGAASDKRLKKDINQLNNALSLINQLNPVTYHFDLEKYPTMGLNTELEYGFIAQEVQQVLPEVVREKNIPLNGGEKLEINSQADNENGKFLTMDYTRIIPILTKGIQEQQSIIDEQNSKIDALEKIVLELQEKINK